MRVFPSKKAFAFSMASSAVKRSDHAKRLASISLPKSLSAGRRQSTSPFSTKRYFVQNLLRGQTTLEVMALQVPSTCRCGKVLLSERVASSVYWTRPSLRAFPSVSSTVAHLHSPQVTSSTVNPTLYATWAREMEKISFPSLFSPTTGTRIPAIG